MGLQCEYFSAEDDEAAATFMQAMEGWTWAPRAFGGQTPPGWPSPTYPTEDIVPGELPYLENFLTGRSVQEIRAHPRFNADIVTEVDEQVRAALAGIVAMTDTFTLALAGADLSTLPEEADYLDVDVLQELAVVAQHAVAHGHHMYCFWME
jgi:hypothetical protein